ncbi:FAD/NAD(P)-binding domain-containing protein [Hypoxylon rubiginosum]|uniref:FAD/NAD(P)-binding domain-containing protein n=1 Tax=Hypoxylon rubiginosum TaxID=110542 RepID=A0ACB9Z1P1_9PEZI|nr:FAD/NAD(P)-binding domain-containing protein [Hypoxylon rubiginosum]
MAPLKIAIVGAGVGGPAAAIGLARNGHIVTLYERAASIGGVGFAFRITPNSDRCLKFLGIDILASGGVAADWSRFMTCDGRMFAEVQENGRPEEKGISAFAYRTELQKQLIDEASSQGAHIKMGVEVTSIDVASCTISFADGSTSSVDLIIGADGVHSCIRPYVVDSSVYFPKASTADSCLRATVPCQAIRDDPITSHIIDDKFRLSGWRADDRLVIGYVVDRGRQFNLVCTHPEELSSSETSSGDDAEKTSYNQKISLETAKTIYKDFDKVVVRLLELADPGGFRVWKLMDMDDIPRWSKNRVVLMGDACHPVMPFGYSGASMAIEDAIALTVLLSSDVGVAQVEDRLRLFERIRRARVYRVRDESRKRSAGSKSEADLREYRNFLSSYDAVGYAEQELKKHQELVS